MNFQSKKKWQGPQFFGFYGEHLLKSCKVEEVDQSLVPPDTIKENPLVQVHSSTSTPNQMAPKATRRSKRL